ncbi:MAG: TetR family transcriptional regulator [Deltaproteobacteria bacterium]|nr:TetR family transcriptional regulator [Deltaproteobacteria bacterium]
MASKQKRQRASQKKKEKIIQTTMQLLLKKGSSSSTSTTDICAGAHLTRPTLYHYFGSKRNLLLSVHMDSIESVLRPYLENAATIDDPLERLTYMIRTYTKDIVCLHPELRVLIHDTLTTKDKYFREVREVWKRHYLLLRDTITALQSEGKMLSEIRPSWAALFVLGMLTWTTYWFDYTRKDEVDHITDAALQLILNGLGLKGITVQ